MADRDQSAGADRTCPNCGGEVTYRGVGRRPVWCSTRCRNDAALRRLGARRGAVGVRLIEVPRPQPGGNSTAVAGLSHASSHPPQSADETRRGTSPPSPDQALGVIRNDPVAVGKLLAHLERRRADGTLLDPEWLPVRNALRLITHGLSPDTERPTTHA